MTPQTKPNSRPFKTEVIECGAHQNTIEAVVISQIEETPDDLYRKVADAIEKVAGSGATLSLRMTSTPLYRKPTDEEKEEAKT